MMRAEYEVPTPPSLNHAFANLKRGGRIKSEHYRNWTQQAGWHVRSQGPIQKVAGRVRISIEIARKETRADLDNLIKPLVDLMVSLGAMDDDRNMDAVSASFVTGPTKVSIEAVE